MLSIPGRVIFDVGRIQIFPMKTSTKYIVFPTIFITLYTHLYIIDSALGCYNKDFNSDGKNMYQGGTLMHDCIIWTPMASYYYNEYNHNTLGLLFYPLIKLDQKYWHKTHRIWDDDFESFMNEVIKHPPNKAIDPSRYRVITNE
jgi:hypothetical protein